MQHIQKIGTQYELTGITEVQDYLDSNWDSGKLNEYDIRYGKSIRKRLRSILVNEQCGFCCYCMRKLYLTNTDNHLRNVTLEHIIPNKIRQVDWIKYKTQYIQFPNLSSDNINVCFDGKLPTEQTKVKIVKKPYPHFISYHNLMASCDGRTIELSTIKEHNCCNNKRGDNFILPMYLDPKMANDIGYDYEGKLDFDDSKYEDSWFQILNLNSSNIQLVRKLWYKISQSDYSAQDIENSINDLSKRQEIIDDIDSENEITSWATNNACWIYLSEYSWFYNYYSTKYPHPKRVI